MSTSMFNTSNNSSPSPHQSGSGGGGGGGAGSSSSSHHQQQQQQQQQYCLKWNNHTNNMVKVFNELLGDENFVDVTLACDGCSIKAHKLVLSACSTYFRDLFINNPCKHPIVILKDIHYGDLQAIIHFMYSGEVNVSYNQLGPLLKTAEALKIKGLTDVNEKHGQAFFNGGGMVNSTAPTTSAARSDPSDHHGSSASSGSFANGTDSMANFYNRMALESLTNQAIVAGGGEPSDAYLAFMAQKFKKRKRKHKNGSAMALANVLQANGAVAAAAVFNSIAAASGQPTPPLPPTTNGYSSQMIINHHHNNNKHQRRDRSPSEKSSSSMMMNNIKSISTVSSGSGHGGSNHHHRMDNSSNNNINKNNNNSHNSSNGSNGNYNTSVATDENDDDDDDDANEHCPMDASAQDSGDESIHNNATVTAAAATLKRLKESVESSESFNDGHRSPSSLPIQPNGLTNTQDMDDDDEEEEDEDGGINHNGDASSANGDHEHSDSMVPNSMMMSMNDSDDEFYPDVKPIVSLDESPSPTNSTMDDSSSFNSSSFAAAVGPILENSLTGSNMPNSSTKVCVCHLCHLTFTAYSSLRRHMTRHYADRERYECDICLKSYSRKDYLKEHKKLKHSDVAKVMSAQRNKSHQAATAGSVS